MIAEIWRNSRRQEQYYIPIFDTQENIRGLKWISNDGSFVTSTHQSKLFNSFRWAKAALGKKFHIVKEVQKADNDLCLVAYEVLVRFNVR